VAIYQEKQARVAPSGSKGIVHWLKDNLFSSPTNTVLTILGILFLYSIIPPFVQWAYTDATFTGDSRAQCTGDGACWTFVKMKMDMFMYGFYPEDQVWRLQTGIGLFIFVIASFKFLKSTKLKILILNLYFLQQYLLECFLMSNMHGMSMVEGKS